MARKRPEIPAVLAAAGGAEGRHGPLKVLIASHSHPELSKGGAEIAAHQLFSALLRSASCEPWFLGCVRDQMNQKLGATLSQPFSGREYLYSVGAFDWLKFSNRDPNFPREFRALLQELRPDVAHFHHYINLGVEVFLHVRESLPDCGIVLTLHEYLAQCHHFGQMVTRQNRTLCYEARPTACTACFSELTPADFFLRRLYIERFFELVDRFVAPSEFLAARYAQWGIPRERISVIENVIPAPGLQRRPKMSDRDTSVLGVGGTCGPQDTRASVLRVGFFGQISALKGINVLMEAAEILAQQGVNAIAFEIHGDHRGQPPEFQADFLARLAKVGHNVKFRGPYDQNRVDQLMLAVDVVLIPSIWWENSPVVIQEALRNRCPIVCSDIGGMAEKVRDGLDGFHYPVGNSVALASLLQGLACRPDRLAEVAKSMRRPPEAEVIVERHEALYAELHSRSAEERNS